MKNKLYDTKKIVKQVLEENESARSSDTVLYTAICLEVNPLAMTTPFAEVILNLDRYGLPPFETVRRTRQKVQAEHPELGSCEDVELFRSENEIAYKEFAVNR